MMWLEPVTECEAAEMADRIWEATMAMQNNKDMSGNISLVDKIKALDQAYRDLLAIGFAVTPEQQSQWGKQLDKVANARNDLGIFRPDSN